MNANSTTKQANPQGSNTETKHTPTPWHVEYGTGIYGADNLHICTTLESRQMPEREGRDLFFETRANAKFIAQACNEHAALCAVAEAAKKIIFDVPNDDAENLAQALASLGAIRNQK